MRALVIVLVAASAASAQAAAVQVKPTRVDLSATETSSLVTITNRDDHTVRFQVTAFAWKDGGDDEVHLDETHDLAVYPTLFTIAAGSARTIRVGVPAPPSGQEQSYRILVSELPPLRRAGDAPGVQVLTRLSIPIFARGAKSEPRQTLAPAGFADGHLQLALRNDGNVHLVVKRVFVRGRDKAGALVVEKELRGWYVLPGAARRYDFDLGGLDVASAEYGVESDAATSRGLLDVGALQPQLELARKQASQAQAQRATSTP